WLKETDVPFPLRLDPARAAYRAYGLERSLLRSWGGQTWLRYAQLLLAGRKWRGIQGDSGQLGGDFIVDNNGIIQFAHPSRTPTDRPAVGQLLAVLKQLPSP
ncbi:MAG: AhpC/TSA family protein, partial [Anaerolineae bacterium]